MGIREDGWFGNWLQAHMQRCPGVDFPKPTENPVYYETWIDQFQHMGVRKDEAEQASARVASMKNVFINNMLALLIDECRKIHEQSEREQQSLVSFAVAKADSWMCPECEGQGWAMREFETTGSDHHHRGALTCRCAAGRWLAQNLDSRDYKADDLQSHTALWRENHERFSTVPSRSLERGFEKGSWFRER